MTRVSEDYPRQLCVGSVEEADFKPGCENYRSSCADDWKPLLMPGQQESAWQDEAAEVASKEVKQRIWMRLVIDLLA